MNENRSDPSGSESHSRPRRPRPSVWWPATTRVHSGSPRVAMASAVLFVEAVTSS